MRGKVIIEGLAKKTPRITPAYAGKSTSPTFSAPAGRDHPRLCGEKSFLLGMAVPATGSPPPMRGKGIAPRAAASYQRITPAYAGKRPVA